MLYILINHNFISLLFDMYMYIINYAGEAFGSFQAMLADIPETLGETIPDFHNMEFRLK